MTRRAFPLCGPRRKFLKIDCLLNAQARPFPNLHRSGRSASPKLRHSNGTKEMLHREHSAMFVRIGTTSHTPSRSCHDSQSAAAGEISSRAYCLADYRSRGPLLSLPMEERPSAPFWPQAWQVFETIRRDPTSKRAQTDVGRFVVNDQSFQKLA